MCRSKDKVLPLKMPFYNGIIKIKSNFYLKPIFDILKKLKRFQIEVVIFLVFIVPHDQTQLS